MNRNEKSWAFETAKLVCQLLSLLIVIPVLNLLRWIFGSYDYTLGEIFGQWLAISFGVAVFSIALGLVLLCIEFGYAWLSSLYRRFNFWLAKRFYS